MLLQVTVNSRLLQKYKLLSTNTRYNYTASGISVGGGGGAATGKGLYEQNNGNNDPIINVANSS